MMIITIMIIMIIIMIKHSRLPVISYPWSFRTQLFLTQLGRFVPSQFIHFVPSSVVSYPVVSYPTGSFRTQSAHSFRTQLGRFVPKLIKYVFQVSNWRKNITLTRAVIVKKVTSKNDRLFN